MPAGISANPTEFEANAAANRSGVAESCFGCRGSRTWGLHGEVAAVGVGAGTAIERGEDAGEVLRGGGGCVVAEIIVHSQPRRLVVADDGGLVLL